MDVDRLKKHTEENVQRMEADNKKQGIDKNTRAGRASQSKPRNSTGLPYSLVSFLFLYHLA